VCGELPERGAQHFWTFFNHKANRRIGWRHHALSCHEIVMVTGSKRVISKWNGSNHATCNPLRNRVEFKIFITDQNSTAVFKTACFNHSHIPPQLGSPIVYNAWLIDLLRSCCMQQMRFPRRSSMTDSVFSATPRPCCHR
jgi:hypothetical protein